MNGSVLAVLLHFADGYTKVRVGRGGEFTSRKKIAAIGALLLHLDASK